MPNTHHPSEFFQITFFRLYIKYSIYRVAKFSLYLISSELFGSMTEFLLCFCKDWEQIIKLFGNNGAALNAVIL